MFEFLAAATWATFIAANLSHSKNTSLGIYLLIVEELQTFHETAVSRLNPYGTARAALHAFDRDNYSCRAPRSSPFIFLGIGRALYWPGVSLFALLQFLRSSVHYYCQQVVNILGILK